MSNQLDYEINKELGECYLLMGDMDKAEEYYQKAIASDASFADSYLGLATVAVQRGNMEDALVLYKKSASITPTDKSICGIGLVYMETNRHEEAFEEFLKALEINPANLIAMNCLVREGYGLNKVDVMLPVLERGMEACADNPAVRITVAGCLITLGRKDEARIHLETVLTMDPVNESAHELIEALAA